jgi:cyclase
MLAFPALAIASAPLRAQEQIAVTEITPTALVFATSSGNAVASVGPDGALLFGMPSAASTSFVSQVLAQRTKSPARYVVIFPQHGPKPQGDAGWGKLGAFVAMHENALRRFGGGRRGLRQASPSDSAELAGDRPHIAFSEVIAFDLNDDAIHIVHQKPGYCDADAVAHFHVANVFYLGEVFPGDGYPFIDAAHGGTLEGLLGQLVWTDPRQRIVPARGKVMNGTDLKAFRDMIVALRDRVQRLIDDGRSESELLAAHPTSDFDGQWGQGRASPDAFVREVYAALKR